MAPHHSERGRALPGGPSVPAPGPACPAPGDPLGLHAAEPWHTTDRRARLRPESSHSTTFHAAGSLSWQGGPPGLAPRRAWGAAQTNLLLPQKPKLAGLESMPVPVARPSSTHLKVDSGPG